MSTNHQRIINKQRIVYTNREKTHSRIQDIYSYNEIESITFGILNQFSKLNGIKKKITDFTHLANAFLNFTNNVSSTIRLFTSNNIMIVRYKNSLFYSSSSQNSKMEKRDDLYSDFQFDF